MLDTTVLGELRVLGDDDLRDLVDLYFADVATQLENLRQALGEGDADAIAAAAHRIKGASLSIGAARVASLATELETAGRSAELSACGGLIAELDSELDPTRSALSAELSF